MAGENTSLSGVEEALPTTADGRRGGRKTIPFIIASVAGMMLAAGGLLNNLIVYLIQEFNVKSINAAQIYNVVSGCTNFFPVIAAIIADSFLGCFPVIWISSLVSLPGLILLVLTATVDSLRPSNGSAPSGFQYTVLFIALALVSIGRGGTSFTLATMGANQLTESHHQAAYFTWFFFILYVSSVISATGIVYVEDNVSWCWGFGICLAANVLGLVVFLLGRRYYCHESRQGSPFASLAQVVVASFRKRKVAISSESDDYYCGVKEVAAKGPTNGFRLLNRAALKIEGDIFPDGSIAKPWRLCTIQQVEDLKTLIRIFPLWSTSILLSTPIGIQGSLTVLQALTTNRHLGPHFQVPAGSMIVFTLLSTAICLSLFDHCIWPLWKKVTHKNPTSLQQIGVGHVFTIASMAVSALVESRRRARAHPMSVLWLVPQLAIVGFGEAFHFPGQVALYYQEFPTRLKSMATAMVAVLIGVGFYLSTLLIDFVRRVSGWLPDNIDDGRLDNVYWVLVVIGVLNFGYFLVCSWFYEYGSGKAMKEDQVSVSHE
ncbi:H+/oligopeptide symporter [Handroanthus impetiginosus]|uniref:H+/oligopeptide symporter n=1 Tax=Handroanthus impetiginosus TaxID=429701 RepID=A0A2G9GC90_9LAMI|nr:H+/oligopeptide symporter [Handroanthus impetiginosus]